MPVRTGMAFFPGLAHPLLTLLARVNTRDGSAIGATDVSRGVFGANVGTDRMLKLFADNDIKASWYMPSHTILSFPEQMAKVRDAGHEM